MFVPFVVLEYVEDPAKLAICVITDDIAGHLLVLCGIDQFPESRSTVFIEEFPGDLSHAGGGPVFILAVSVEIEGRVCEDGTGGV